MDLSVLTQAALTAADYAVEEILAVYNSGTVQTEMKHDNSPLTLADRRAHKAIVSVLGNTGIPMLSEEGKDIPYETRRHWEYLWLVDPLDGTKEFLKRNGEFTVNIALIHNQQPVLGVVAVPVTGDVYFASAGNGAFVRRNGKIQPLVKRKPVTLYQPGLRVVASRSHLNDATLQFIEKLKDPQLLSKGSSLKFMLLAEGLADVYPRFAPTMEWDTAAGHAIVNEVGIPVLQKEKFTELVYNKEDLVNPSFVCYKDFDTI